jgi:hypothetical protein
LDSNSPDQTAKAAHGSMRTGCAKDMCTSASAPASESPLAIWPHLNADWADLDDEIQSVIQQWGIGPVHANAAPRPADASTGAHSHSAAKPPLNAPHSWEPEEALAALQQQMAVQQLEREVFLMRKQQELSIPKLQCAVRSADLALQASLSAPRAHSDGQPRAAHGARHAKAYATAPTAPLAHASGLDARAPSFHPPAAAGTPDTRSLQPVPNKELHGLVSDKEIAAAEGVSRSCIRRRRREAQMQAALAKSSGQTKQYAPPNNNHGAHRHDTGMGMDPLCSMGLVGNHTAHQTYPAGWHNGGQGHQQYHH